MADLTFDEAVKVVELIEEGHKHLTPAIGDKTPATMTEYIVAGYAMGATAADRRALLLYELPLAAMDSAVWDAIDRIAQAHLRSGYPMPRELGEWDAARREGKRPRPSKRGPKPKPVRDKVIASTVQALVDRGFYPTGHPRLRMTSERTRGRASAVRGSACDTVGLAFGMNYKAVEKVWNNSTTSDRVLLRPAVDQYFAAYEAQGNK